MTPQFLNSKQKAVFDTLTDWGVTDKVKGVFCDTTVSNTGNVNEACVLFEQLMGLNLLYRPCRHNILDNLLREYISCEDEFTSKSPDILILKSFQEVWSKISTRKFESECEILM